MTGAGSPQGTSSWQGQGWWQAEDGEWHPPEAHPGYGSPRLFPTDAAADVTADVEDTTASTHADDELTTALAKLADTEANVKALLAALRDTDPEVITPR